MVPRSVEYYVIRSMSPDHDGLFLYWSNADGWVGDIEDADTFSHVDVELCTLPMDGEWVKIEGLA